MTIDVAPLCIPDELVSRVKSGQAVPFVGAGLSRASGIVGWDELVERLRAHVGGWMGRKISSEELDLFETPLLYTNSAGTRQPLYDVLDQAVGEGFEPSGLHHLLSQLPVNSILTTNWDQLIEVALRREGRPANVIFDDMRVASWNEARAVQVVKMHGSIDSHESIVFGEDDYQRLYTSDSLMLNLVKTLLATRSIFAIGFSMSDTYVKMLFSHVARLAGESRNPHYVVIADDGQSEMRVEYLKAAGFRIISVPTSPDDAYGAETFVRELHKLTYSFTTDRVDRAMLIHRETAALRNYLGSERIIRVRATMGPLACPPNLGVDEQRAMFGSEQRYGVEFALRELCIDLARDRGVTLRLIGTPRAKSFVEGKGWPAEAYEARLNALVEAANELGDQFEFAEAVRPSDANEWAVSDLSMIASRKIDPDNQRLYDGAELETDRDRIRRANRAFDEEFDALTARAGGANNALADLLEGKA